MNYSWFLGRSSKETVTAPFHKCFLPFVRFYSLLSLSEGIYVFQFHHLIVGKSLVLGRQILCLWVFHTVLSGCLLNKHAIFSTSNSLAKLPSIGYMVFFPTIIFSSLETMSVLCIYFFSFLPYFKIHVAPWIKATILKIILSPQFIPLPYLVLSTRCLIMWMYCDVNFQITGLNHIMLHVSNNIPDDKHNYLLLSTYYVLSSLLNFSHSFFPLNSQKYLPVRYWKHNFTNKKKEDK